MDANRTNTTNFVLVKGMLNFAGKYAVIQPASFDYGSALHCHSGCLYYGRGGLSEIEDRRVDENESASECSTCN